MSGARIQVVTDRGLVSRHGARHGAVTKAHAVCAAHHTADVKPQDTPTPFSTAPELDRGGMAESEFMSCGCSISMGVHSMTHRHSCLAPCGKPHKYASAVTLVKTLASLHRSLLATGCVRPHATCHALLQFSSFSDVRRSTHGHGHKLTLPHS